MRELLASSDIVCLSAAYPLGRKLTRRDKVERNLDTAGEVAHLVSAPGGDEHRLTGVLVHAEALDALVLKQLLAQRGVEVEHLRVDWVGEELGLGGVFGRQEVADRVGVLGAEEVPHRAPG